MELIVILLVCAGCLFLLPKRSRRRGRSVNRRRADRPASDRISGKAYVTDGDGMRVSGIEIRIAGIDAPEWDQLAKHRDGYWFRHGRKVKSALIQEIGGKTVQVKIEDFDKFGRAVGTVTCGGKDLGEWLVRQGFARALYCDRYEHVEREARLAGRGMWSHQVNIDPRSWRKKQESRLR